MVVEICWGVFGKWGWSLVVYTVVPLESLSERRCHGLEVIDLVLIDLNRCLIMLTRNTDKELFIKLS